MNVREQRDLVPGCRVPPTPLTLGELAKSHFDTPGQQAYVLTLAAPEPLRLELSKSSAYAEVTASVWQAGGGTTKQVCRFDLAKPNEALCQTFRKAFFSSRASHLFIVLSALSLSSRVDFAFRVFAPGSVRR